MDSVINIISKLIKKEVDLTQISFKTPGTLYFHFYWFNKDGHPKNTDWELTGVTDIKIISQINQHYLQVKEYEITKKNNLYYLFLKLESNTEISVTFEKIKAIIS